VLRLTAFDGFATAHDEVTITVTEAEMSDYEAWLIENGIDDEEPIQGVHPYFLYLSGWTPGEDGEPADIGEAGRLQVVRETGNAGPAFAWIFRAGMIPGLDFEIWLSLDLQAWRIALESEFTLVEQEDSSAGKIRYELSPAESLGSKVFLRLQKPAQTP